MCERLDLAGGARIVSVGAERLAEDSIKDSIKDSFQEVAPPLACLTQLRYTSMPEIMPEIMRAAIAPYGDQL